MIIKIVFGKHFQKVYSLSIMLLLIFNQLQASVSRF